MANVQVNAKGFLQNLASRMGHDTYSLIIEELNNIKIKHLQKNSSKDLKFHFIPLKFNGRKWKIYFIVDNINGFENIGEFNRAITISSSIKSEFSNCGLGSKLFFSKFGIPGKGIWWTKNSSGEQYMATWNCKTSDPEIRDDIFFKVDSSNYPDFEPIISFIYDKYFNINIDENCSGSFKMIIDDPNVTCEEILSALKTNDLSTCYIDTDQMDIKDTSLNKYYDKFRTPRYIGKNPLYPKLNVLIGEHCFNLLETHTNFKIYISNCVVPSVPFTFSDDGLGCGSITNKLVINYHESKPEKVSVYIVEDTIYKKILQTPSRSSTDTIKEVDEGSLPKEGNWISAEFTTAFIETNKWKEQHIFGRDMELGLDIRRNLLILVNDRVLSRASTSIGKSANWTGLRIIFNINNIKGEEHSVLLDIDQKKVDSTIKKNINNILKNLYWYNHAKLYQMQQQGKCKTYPVYEHIVDIKDTQELTQQIEDTKIVLSKKKDRQDFGKREVEKGHERFSGRCPFTGQKLNLDGQKGVSWEADHYDDDRSNNSWENYNPIVKSAHSYKTKCSENLRRAKDKLEEKKGSADGDEIRRLENKIRECEGEYTTYLEQPHIKHIQDLEHGLEALSQKNFGHKKNLSYDDDTVSKLLIKAISHQNESVRKKILESLST